MTTKTFAILAALTALAVPAHAQSVTDAVNGVTGGLNGQLNLGGINAELDAAIEEAGEASLTAAGIGNSLSATVDTARFGALVQGIGQTNEGDITASLNGAIKEIDGTVSATSAAIGNSVSLTVSSANGVVGAAIGQTNVGDVSASADIAVSEARKAVSATAAAIGNSISITNGLTD